MCKNKLKLLKKLFKNKINALKVQNQELNVYVQRQIFKFYQEIRMDLIMNKNISESNSGIMSSWIKA